VLTKCTPINEMRRNDLFEGISTEDLDKKEKYVHFRQVESSEKKKIKMPWTKLLLILIFI
jgi:hypothetical protein